MPYRLAIPQTGGRGEIRTHERLAPLPVFKTGAFNRSATLPTKNTQIHWVQTPSSVALTPLYVKICASFFPIITQKVDKVQLYS